MRAGPPSKCLQEYRRADARPFDAIGRRPHRHHATALIAGSRVILHASTAFTGRSARFSSGGDGAPVLLMPSAQSPLPRRRSFATCTRVDVGDIISAQDISMRALMASASATRRAWPICAAMASTMPRDRNDATRKQRFSDRCCFSSACSCCTLLTSHIINTMLIISRDSFIMATIIAHAI